MTVNSTTNRVEYAGDGSSTVFAVGFYFLIEADLKVFLRSAAGVETLQTLTTHYTTSGAGNLAGGSVTMVTAPASGEKLVIIRDPALTQLTDYQANDAFPAETHERALDKLTMQAQRLAERIDRAVTVEDTSASDNIELPDPASNADKFLKINVAGDAIEAVAVSVLSDTVDTVETSPVDNDVLVRDTDKWRNKPMFGYVSDVTIASAATTDVLGAAGPHVIVTGTATITSLGTGANRFRVVRFTGAATLTHNASTLILPGGANITTAAGDAMWVEADSSSNARVLFFQRADGTSITASTNPTLGFSNLGLAVSVSSNDITIALKGADGNDPSVSNPVKIGFRSATLTSGDTSIISVAAATSLTISAGSTLGFSNSEAGRIYVGAIDNSGTVELVAWRSLNGVNLYKPLESVLHSTTAEGGAGGADSAAVVYSATARSNVPLRILGYFEITTGATAGNWSNAPTVIQVMGPGVPVTGKVIQNVVSVDGAYTTGTTVMPDDNSIPQNTEGDQFLTVTLTPTSSLNLLKIEVQAALSPASGAFVVGALFQDSAADAIASMQTFDAGGQYGNITLKHTMVSGTSSSTDLDFRAGGSTGAVVGFNGHGGSARMGGNMASFIEVNEVFV